MSKGGPKDMDKKFWIVIGVIAVVFVGILFFRGGDNSSGDGQQTAATNHTKGKQDAKVTLVEYGDFQCPVCGAYYPVVSQVVDEYQNRIKFQFRNLPLSQVHKHAFAAARAAEAAAEQGKFWEMYNALFSGQQQWSQSNSPTTDFRQYAIDNNLDMAKYDKAFASDAVNKKINADLAAFKKTGDPMATPTFYLNGKKLELVELAGSSGAPTAKNLSAKIDEALKNAK
jgi:protein-disulfide isomerase